MVAPFVVGAFIPIRSVVDGIHDTHEAIDTHSTVYESGVGQLYAHASFLNILPALRSNALRISAAV